MTYLALLAGDVLTTGLFGLALRALIEGALHRDLRVALGATVVAALCWTTSAVGSWARTNMVYLLAEAVSVELDTRILGMVGRLDTVEHLENPEYVDRVALLRGGGDLLAHYAWGLLDVVATLLRLAIVLTLLAVVAPPMLALALLLGPVLWLQRRGQQRISHSLLATAEGTRLADHLYSLLTEPAAGMEIRIAGAGEALQERARLTRTSLIRQQEHARWAAAGLALAGWTLFVLGYAVALLFIMDSVSSGRAEPGDVLLVITLTMNLRAQAEGTIATLQRTGEGLHFLDAYLWLNARAAGTASSGRAAVPDRLDAGITLRGVSFSYPGTELPVLRDIDLHVPAGSTLAIVGEHGAGKSTLVKLLCKLYEPTGGTIAVDGVPLADLPAEQWRSRTTASFQDYARFAFLLRESVGVGDLSALDDLARIGRAVAHGDAELIVEQLPSGLETQLGGLFDGLELSGGQWQRVALSRAFMRPTPLLFALDEPTASLDARSEYTVYQRQLEFAKRHARASGTVTVMISHRFSTVRTADHIVVLSDGRIVERGSHEELMTLGGNYAELYTLQADGYKPSPSQAPARRRDAVSVTPQAGPHDPGHRPSTDPS
ncbi:ABC transporter ATP-binding protein [Kitasatospora kifunensis]